MIESAILHVVLDDNDGEGILFVLVLGVLRSHGCWLWQDWVCYECRSLEYNAWRRLPGGSEFSFWLELLVRCWVRSEGVWFLELTCAEYKRLLSSCDSLSSTEQLVSYCCWLSNS